MGTLFEQKPRVFKNANPGDYMVCHAQVLVDQYGITFDQALRCIELEFRIDDYDVRDEQLAGFGELMQDFIMVLERFIDENTSH